MSIQSINKAMNGKAGITIEQFVKFASDHIEEISLIVAVFSALIAVISTIAAFMANHQSKKQYEESIQPQLSMSLVEINSLLYLRIKNTGQLAAKDVKIRVNGIKNNGNADQLFPDDLFTTEFELYPEEVVQGRVAIYGRNIEQSVFPQVKVSVSYRTDGVKKATTYNRTVTYLAAYTEKIAADVKINTEQMESSLKSIARASVRTANYLDGRQIEPFDEVNIRADCSLRNDLIGVLHDERGKIIDRTESIIEAKTREKEDTHADT